MKDCTQISNDILYVGVDDLDIDLFESQYVVPEGMSYNSYVIRDEKTAILDTCDQRKGEEWLKNVERALNGVQPDFLICHHMEPDHAALIAEALKRWPSLTLVTSPIALRYVPQFNEHLDLDGRALTVKEGDTLHLGKHILHFIGAPMVHWPEVLMSYDATDKVLFSADGFGKFGAIQNETEDWDCEARRYYFNIVGKYGQQVQSVLKKAAGLDIEIICPLHGPILHAPLGHYLQQYDTWSSYRPESEGTLVAVASIHGGTMVAAQELAKMLEEAGCKKVIVSDLCRDDIAEVIEDAFRYGSMVLCAASYDADVFPPMHDFLHHLQLKGYRNRRVGMVENGTWAPTAARAMKALLEPMKDITLVEPVVTLRSRMHESDKEALRQLATEIVKS